MQRPDSNKLIYVIKANGEKELFDEDKIRHSLERSGASQDLIDTVIENTAEKIYPNISTKKLYRLLFNELRMYHRPAAGKYHLKRAIMEFGPTGFPFEEFIAEIFRSDGFRISVGQIVEGYCVKHEVDVIAQNSKELFMIECKFHSDPGNVCDVKNSLYVHARFQDIERKKQSLHEPAERIFKGWLVTNTRLTADAEQYGVCSGLELMSWNFPSGKSLRERIDKAGLHPVTCITSLVRSEKQQLLDKKIVLCETLSARPALLTELGISELRKEKILQEARSIIMKNQEL